MRRLLLSALLLFCLPLPAHAALNLCDRTSYILYAATATVGGGARQAQAQIQTQGWTRLVPGECAQALKTLPAGQRILVYARSALAHSGPQRAWGGNFPACVREGNFSLRQGATPYCTDDSFSVPFAAIARANKSGDATMNFDEQPALSSLTAAQLAGVKRLLKDNGYAVGAITGPPDKVTGKSLKEFRARLHFAANADNDALFAGLESEALKHAAPAGYTVCNDAATPLLVAMADTGGKAAVSRGWWRIDGGACARTITTPLTGDAIYLAAQKPDGTAVVSGADKFCVTPQEFEIQGRGNCAARGLGEAGFAKTVTKSVSGYVAHIGKSGPPPVGKSGPPPALHTGISK